MPRPQLKRVAPDARHSPHVCECAGQRFASRLSLAQIWQIRQAVYRTVLDAYDHGELIVAVGADKAYMSATQWDLAGCAL